MMTALVVPVSASAEVIVINEFSARSNPDWVEIYFEGVDINLYQLRDSSSSGNPKDLSGAICNGSFCTIDWGDSLNVNEDTIKLVLKSDPNTVIDSRTYGGSENVCVPEEGRSVGRVDNASTFERFATPTKGATNVGAQLEPCPAPSTPTPTPSPTASSTPTPTSTPTATPVATKSPTPKPSTSATPRTTNVPVAQNKPGDGVLGLREGLSNSPPPSGAPAETSTGSGGFPIAAVMFVAGGGTLMGLGALSFLKQKKSGYTE